MTALSTNTISGSSPINWSREKNFGNPFAGTGRTSGAPSFSGGTTCIPPRIIRLRLVPYTDPMAIRFSTSTANPWSYDTRSRGIWGNSPSPPSGARPPESTHRSGSRNQPDGSRNVTNPTYRSSICPIWIMTFSASGRMIPESRRRSGPSMRSPEISSTFSKNGGFG